jgi:hypothetical protein
MHVPCMYVCMYVPVDAFHSLWIRNNSLRIQIPHTEIPDTDPNLKEGQVKKNHILLEQNTAPARLVKLSSGNM